MRLRTSTLLVITLITLGVSLFLKRPCLTLPWGPPNNIQYASACYNDIQPFYYLRHFTQNSIPYIEENPFEYPPIIALQTWVSSYFAKEHVQFFYVNSIFLAIAAIVTLLALIGTVGAQRRVLWFAAALPLVWYAFYNWELLAMAALALAMWSWRKKNYSATGAFLGIGMAAKLFPAFVLPALLVAAYDNPRRKKTIAALVLGFFAAWLAINLPFLIGDWAKNGSINGWLSMFTFHSHRHPDYGSIWYWLGPVTNEYKVLIDRVSFILFALGALSLLVVQRLRRTSIDPWAIGAAIVALFLLVNKVHSPQYAMWLLPFFVVTRTPAALILAYFFIDGLVLQSGMRSMAESQSAEPSVLRQIHIAAIFARGALLVILIGFYAKAVEIFPCTLGYRNKTSDLPEKP